MTVPRLHQVRSTIEDRTTASTTPDVTASTRRSPVVSVANRLTWTTSNAVSGPVSGWVCGNASRATTYAITAGMVRRIARRLAAHPRRRTRSTNLAPARPSAVGPCRADRSTVCTHATLRGWPSPAAAQTAGVPEGPR